MVFLPFTSNSSYANSFDSLKLLNRKIKACVTLYFCRGEVQMAVVGRAGRLCSSHLVPPRENFSTVTFILDCYNVEQHSPHMLALQFVWQVAVCLPFPTALVMVSIQQIVVSSVTPIAFPTTETEAVTQSSWKNMKQSRFQVAGCAQAFHQCLVTAVSTPVGNMTRWKYFSACGQSFGRRWVGWWTSGSWRRLTGGAVLCHPQDRCFSWPQQEKWRATSLLKNRRKEGSKEREGNRGRFLLGVAGESPPCPSHPHIQVPFYIRKEALEFDEQIHYVDEGSSRLQDHLGLDSLSPISWAPRSIQEVFLW